MSRPRKANGVIRPIRNKRDYEGASNVAKRLSSQADRDSAAELRLQALLRELDRFDEAVEDADPDSADDLDYGGPRRRWSDESDA